MTDIEVSLFALSDENRLVDTAEVLQQSNGFT